MILNNDEILAAYKSGDIMISPFVDKQLQGATYDFRVGPEGATTSLKRVVNIKEAGFLVIQPGDFATVLALEELRLSPMYVGRFGLRSKLARKGLVAAIGPQIDPGYHGCLTVALANLSPRPVSLSYGEDFVSVEFHRLAEASTRPYIGPYQDRLTLGPEELETIAETEGLAFSEVLTTLRSLSQNVGSLTEHVDRLTTDVGSLTEQVQTLSADFRSLFGKLSELSGQLAGSRWLTPVLVGLITAVLAVLIGMMWKR